MIVDHRVQVSESDQISVQSFEQIPRNVTLSLDLYYTSRAYEDTVPSTVMASLLASTDMVDKGHPRGDRTARATLHPDPPELGLRDAGLPA